MLKIEDITYSVEGRPLFEGASATIPTGHKVGLVGRNGAGKTTLFRLIKKELALESGDISMPTRARIGGVAQEVPSSSTSLIDTVWAFLIPIAYIFAFGVFGLWLNIRMPRLDWQSEAEAVKQSGSVMVSIFTGMGVAAIPAIVSGVTQSPLVAPITFVVLVGLSIAMWSSLVKSGEKRMLMLH